jgi:hypothetical protein
MTTNTRIGIPVNLPEGATHELLVFRYADAFPEGKLEFEIGDNPKKITGIQKVAQTFLRVLFTSVGSDVLNQTLGTNFSNLTINANRTSVDRDLYIALHNEIKNAETQCIGILNNSGADDASQLKKISILGLDTGKESITMYLQLVTEAGELAQVAVPFPELDTPLSQA